MSVSLVKGQKINLSKEVEGLSKVKVCLGWDANRMFFRPAIDCDASVFVIGNKKVNETVFYGHTRGAAGCVIHHGDNLTGAGDGDDEVISVNLRDMPVNCDRLTFVVNIYDCISRGQHFGMIKNAYIRIVDEVSGKELCKYNLTDNYDKKTAMIFGELYKKDNEWRFNAIGQGTNDASISQLKNRF